jgi:hypothetical protein
VIFIVFIQFWEFSFKPTQVTHQPTGIGSSSENTHGWPSRKVVPGLAQNGIEANIEKPVLAPKIWMVVQLV